MNKLSLDILAALEGRRFPTSRTIVTVRTLDGVIIYSQYH